MPGPPIAPSSAPIGSSAPAEPPLTPARGSRRPLTLPRASPLRRRLVRIYDALYRRFGPQGWWPGRSAFEVVVGAILTQRTAWVNVERALVRLRRAGALRPAALGALAAGRLAALIRPSGFYRVKAERLRALVRHLARRHRGDLRRFLRQPAPAARAALLSIPGIGAETADAILLYAAGRPVFVVDAYTRRVLARHRIVAPTAGYATVQAVFAENLPQDPALFNEYHALLVRVAKEYCRARPRCARCPLRFDLGGRSPRLPGQRPLRPEGVRIPRALASPGGLTRGSRPGRFTPSRGSAAASEGGHRGGVPTPPRRG